MVISSRKVFEKGPAVKGSPGKKKNGGHQRGAEKGKSRRNLDRKRGGDGQRVNRGKRIYFGVWERGKEGREGG